MESHRLDFTKRRWKPVWGKPSPCRQTNWRSQFKAFTSVQTGFQQPQSLQELSTKNILAHICNWKTDVKQSDEYFLFKVTILFIQTEFKTKNWFHINLSTLRGTFEHQSRRNCRLVLEGSALFLCFPFFLLYTLLRWLKILHFSVFYKYFLHVLFPTLSWNNFQAIQEIISQIVLMRVSILLT